MEADIEAPVVGADADRRVASSTIGEHQVDTCLTLKASTINRKLKHVLGVMV